MTVGLTGGIASGKSLVAGELERLGARIVDADLVSREVVRPGTPAHAGIVEAFGPEVLLEDGGIDRKKLGSIVFSDPRKLEMLNSITHPRIRERIRELVLEARRADPSALIVIDAALLIEGGLFREMSKVIVVYADENTQAERLARRDRITPEEAQKRIRSQMPLKEKLKYADYVIDNNGEPESTLERVREIYGELAEKT
ncbi:MAG TPA: dephospho-CoA kinase [Thermodesulfobacteriota bacterium]|nr:dephospho-CoA kinase [Thermodesulfobacteriota bacterium]